MDAARIEKYEQRILRRERSYRRTKWAAIGLAVFLLVVTGSLFVMARMVESSAPPNPSPEVRASFASMRESELEVYRSAPVLVVFAFLAACYAQARLRHIESIRYYREAR